MAGEGVVLMGGRVRGPIQSGNHQQADLPLLEKPAESPPRFR